jgi:tRNA(Ile)-lysidine synthase
LQKIREEEGWTPGLRLAVAVSGGVDSVVLLHLLHRTQAAHRAELRVVHVHHGTAQADAFEAFVSALAGELALPLVVERLAPRRDDEASLREARYERLLQQDADRVVLAHHRRDQAETVLLRLLRGTGTGGLGAMRPRRGKLWRPLLDVDPRALRAWAQARGVSWIEDESNQGPRYARNRLRALWPALEGVQPGAEGAIAAAARWFAEDEALLALLAAEAPQPLTWSWLRAAPPPLARRALRAWDPRLTLAQAQRLLEEPPPLEVAGRRYEDLGGLVVAGGAERGQASPTPSRGGSGC